MKTTKHRHRSPAGRPPTEAEMEARFRATAASVAARRTARPAAAVDRRPDSGELAPERRVGIEKRVRRIDPPG